MSAVSSLVLIAAALLDVGARRLRALAMGDDAGLRDWVTSESAWRLTEARRDAPRVLARITGLGAHFIPLGDAGYPIALLDLRDPPPFLCVLGSLPQSPSGGSGTAIVGTRQASERGERLARELVAHVGGPIVSGLARGIDAAAHRAALVAAVPTIAYVGNGLGTTYPPEHEELAAEIVAAGGAIVSELLPDQPVRRGSLLRRDRLQAAHARAVVVVESEANGGAMETLRVATLLGRQRYTCDPREVEHSSGNDVAISRGAIALRPPFDGLH